MQVTIKQTGTSELSWEYDDLSMGISLMHNLNFIYLFILQSILPCAYRRMWKVCQWCIYCIIMRLNYDYLCIWIIAAEAFSQCPNDFLFWPCACSRLCYVWSNCAGSSRGSYTTIKNCNNWCHTTHMFPEFMFLVCLWCISYNKYYQR